LYCIQITFTSSKLIKINVRQGYIFPFVTPRLAKRIAALKLATVISTHNATPSHPKSAVYTADWAPGCESEQDSQSSEEEDEVRSGAKVAIAAFSDAMESLHQVATNGGRVSPLRMADC